VNGEHLLGGRRLNLDPFAAGKLHVHLVARRVRGDAGVVEHHSERKQGFPDRLSFAPLRGERGNQVGDVARGDGVDPPSSEQGQHRSRGAPVLKLRVLGSVDPRGLPALCRFGERRRSLGLLVEHVNVGEAQRGELVVDPLAAGECLAPRAEAATVASRALPAPDPEFDPVALRAAARRARGDPTRGHYAVTLSGVVSASSRRFLASRAQRPATSAETPAAVLRPPGA
jgi:hypothetical protein